MQEITQQAAAYAQIAQLVIAQLPKGRPVVEELVSELKYYNATYVVPLNDYINDRAIADTKKFYLEFLELTGDGILAASMTRDTMNRIAETIRSVKLGGK